MEAGALEIGLRAAQRFSVGIRTHQNAGEVFCSGTQRHAESFVPENLSEKFRLRLGHRRNLPIRPGFRLGHSYRRCCGRLACLGLGRSPGSRHILRRLGRRLGFGSRLSSGSRSWIIRRLWLLVGRPWLRWRGLGTVLRARRACCRSGCFRLRLGRRYGIPPHNVPHCEGHPKQQRNHEKAAEQLPVPQHQLEFVFAVPHFFVTPVPAGVLPAARSKTRCMLAIISTGSGKTMVVFFSEPISTRVCR